MNFADALTVLGLALVAAGAGLAYLPLGVIFAGIAAVLVGIGLSEEMKS